MRLNVIKDIRKPPFPWTAYWKKNMYKGQKLQENSKIISFVQNDSTSWIQPTEITNIHHKKHYMDAHHCFILLKTTIIHMNKDWQILTYPCKECKSYYEGLYNGLKYSKYILSVKCQLENIMYSSSPTFFIPKCEDVCVLFCVHNFLYFQIFYSKYIYSRKFLILFHISWVIYTYLKLIGERKQTKTGIHYKVKSPHD